MNQKHVRQCLVEAFQEVYDIFKVQAGHDLSPKQKQFINVAARKICGKEEPLKVGLSPLSKEDKKELAKIQKEDKPFYECECGKRCSSTSGLTLHKKLVHGNTI